TQYALSFDTTVALGGVPVQNKDLIAIDLIPSAPFVFFDGTTAGVATGLNLDAAHRLGNGHLLLSFDSSGSVGGVAFSREDVLEYDPVGNTWEKSYDGATHGWPRGANLI